MNGIQVTMFRKSWRWVGLVCLSMLIALLSAHRLDAQTEPDVLRVAIRDVEPFAFKHEDQFIGFSIDLWEKIAKRLELEFEFVETDSATHMIELVAAGEVDLGITSISITSEREEIVDFSLPMFEAGLQIATRTTPADNFLTIVLAIFSPLILRGLGIALLVLLIVAHVVWWTERHENSDFHVDYLHGIWEAFYWATVTATTVGYGDKVPRRVPGQLVALVWTLLSLFLVSYFTASVTTALTLRQLQSSINGPKDLRGYVVGTVEGSTSDEYLTSRGHLITRYESVDTMLTALVDEEVEAILYDAPVLQYATLQSGFRGVRLVEPIFQPEDYGIVLADDSPYLEGVNQTLLKLREDGTYEQLVVQWFGE